MTDLRFVHFRYSYIMVNSILLIVLLPLQMFAWPRFMKTIVIQWGVKLTTHCHITSRSKLVKLYFRSPIHLHGLVFN
jgi:hypothetical protein